MNNINTNKTKLNQRLNVNGQSNTVYKINAFNTENLQLFGLIIWMIFAVYYAPKIISLLSVVAIILLFFLSKKDYFWLAFFLAIYFTPLAFFNESSGTAVHRLPVFKLGPGAAFTTEQVFLLVALLKAFNKRKTYHYIIRNAFYIIVFYFGILMFAAMFVHHSGFDNVIDTVKKLLTWALLFVLPVLLSKREDVYKFIYLLLPLVFVVFLGAIFFYASGGVYFYNVVNPAEDLRMLTQTYSDVAGRFIPHGGQFQTIFLGFILSLFLLNFKAGNKAYLYTLVIISYIIIIMGAYRSWFVIFSLVFIGFILISKNRGRSLMIITSISIVILIGMSQSEKGSIAMNTAWERVATIFELGQKGSASTEQMQHKQTQRLPQQLKWIKENPVLGWGFTDKKGDPDVGNFALLVDVGLLGFLLYGWLWISYVRMIMNARRRLPKGSDFRIGLSILLFGFLGLLLSHFTTNRIFGITSAASLLSLYFFFSDFFVKDSIGEYNIKYQAKRVLPVKETEEPKENENKILKQAKSRN